MMPVSELLYSRRDRNCVVFTAAQHVCEVYEVVYISEAPDVVLPHNA